MLENNSGESELRAFINGVLGHYHELFQMKVAAVKEDAFFIMHGLWRTPTERFSQWLGGPRPSQLLHVFVFLNEH
ncbi:hypothetical protein L1987_65323 [Smallanthus sonchifolius]|uniref:Uncharacterized protein n=1 Tax=Smallanthus sonchifolius TaxID=185202 RepID=A0ACB9BU30_9ASTR|nr:hypothetical protein L1987_65323 [Smallanthus sonchifolius]